MSIIKGTATISLETLDNMREYEVLFKRAKKTASGLIKRIDSAQYEKMCKKIDAMKEISDNDINQLLKEAEETLKIVVSEECLRRLIREYIDSEKSELHFELGKMTEGEFAKIPLILESGQHQEQAGGQQDESVCKMCEAYMTDAECDMKEECPAAGIVKRMKEAETEIKEKEKIIKERDKKIRELEKKLDDSERKSSYMIDPMAIGDRHEMGG